MTLPERISRTNEDKDTPKELGDFLVKSDFIKEVGILKNSWGFMYSKDTRKISIADTEMSQEAYLYYIFRLGKDINGENLFPKFGDETDQYRFLHETCHAYQEYLVYKELSDKNLDQSSWYADSVNGKNDSTFSILFNLCYKIRNSNENKGLSTWGNVPDYNSIQNDASRIASRALEDSNELIVMRLWNPKYLETFLDYVSLNIDGYNESSLNEDNLVKIANNTKILIKHIVDLYVEEMKNNIK
ncbi:MAG: hypothetical protein NTV03_01660 [Candidatus Nomurabacteria bacterium]|nr:hypothetical protein [Candidatus Nomurabacteria bacterium]